MYNRIWCSALVMLAVVVWSWAASCVHCVKGTVRLLVKILDAASWPTGEINCNLAGPSIRAVDNEIIDVIHYIARRSVTL